MDDLKSNGSNSLLQKIVFIVLLLACFTPYVSAAIALILGIVVAQTTGHPFIKFNQKATHYLLQISVVGLGFGLNVTTALEAGKDGFWLTVLTIAGTLFLGVLLGKLLKIDKKITYLISSGTAICGGSAIAAISPTIKAEENQITVALGVIFILNSIALIIFPFIGHHFNLSQTQFGLWCAVAIHDTSSVVGAAERFGQEALQTATTVKLARALWIIPLSIISAIVFNNKGSKIKIPYFIGLFVVAILINTYVPLPQIVNQSIYKISKIGLTITLFLIGCGLSKGAIKAVGPKPLLLGVILWLVIASSMLFVILNW